MQSSESAVIDGVVAVSAMALMMLLVCRKDVMGRFVVSTPLEVMGRHATGGHGARAIGMFATWGS